MRPLLAATVLVLSAAASDGPPAPIVTDRPAVTGSSIVVPSGSLQVESGFAWTAGLGQNTFDGPQSELRFGVASRTELRLIAPDYFRQPGQGPTSGFSDTTVGVKQQLPPMHGFDVSLVLWLSLPSGARAVSSHGYDPFVQLPWSRALSPKWTAAGMLSVYWPTQGTRRKVTGETTFLFDRQLTKTSDAFFEYAGDFPEAGGPRHLVHFGTAWRVTSRHQFDLHGGAGLSAAAVDHFVGIGYSFRLQVVRR